MPKSSNAVCEIPFDVFKKKHKHEYYELLGFLELTDLRRGSLLMAEINTMCLFSIKGKAYYAYMGRVKEFYTLHNFISENIQQEQGYDFIVGHFGSSNWEKRKLEFYYIIHEGQGRFFQMFNCKSVEAASLTTIFMYMLDKVLINLSSIVVNLWPEDNLGEIFKQSGFLPEPTNTSFLALKKAFDK